LSEPYYLEPKEYEAYIKAIEKRFGPYRYRPRVVVKPNLYKMYGSLGQTQFLKTTDGTPVLIEIDEDIWKRPYLGIETLVHELLEWKFIEAGEEFPHYLSETYTPEILGKATRTFIDFFFQQHPVFRRFLMGY
jgi:hypothetical protein